MKRGDKVQVENRPNGIYVGHLGIYNSSDLVVVETPGGMLYLAHESKVKPFQERPLYCPFCGHGTDGRGGLCLDQSSQWGVNWQHQYSCYQCKRKFYVDAPR